MTVKDHCLKNYSCDIQKLPKRLCARCTKILKRVALDKADVDKIPKLPKNSELDFGGLTGRLLISLTDCKCSICKFAHRSILGRGGAVFSLGRPRETRVKLPETLCTECNSVKAKGIPHQCNVSNARKNLQAYCSKDPVARKMIASLVIREKVAATHSSSSVQLKTG